MSLDNDKFDLACGETVTLTELSIERTHAGFLEGHPIAIDQRVIMRLPERIRRRYPRQPYVVVDPPNRALNLGKCVICGKETNIVQRREIDLAGDYMGIELLACAQHPINNTTMHAASESLRASGRFEPLPSWLCVGHFRSYAEGGHIDLLICWFAESVDVHVRDLIGENIRAVDWHGLGEFTSYDDY